MLRMLGAGTGGHKGLALKVSGVAIFLSVAMLVKQSIILRKIPLRVYLPLDRFHSKESQAIGDRVHLVKAGPLTPEFATILSH